MPPVAAAGAAIAGSIGTAVAGMSLAQGLMIAGTGLSVLGKATGSKTLTNIGLGFSGAGAVTGIAKGFSAANAASAADDMATVSGNTAKTTKLLNKDNIDEALAGNIKGAKGMDQLKKFNPVDTSSKSMESFANSAANIGNGADNLNINQGFDQGFLQRAGNTLRKYDTTANMLMGAGNAYMGTRSIDAQKDMLDKRLNFEQKQIDRQQASFAPSPNPVRRPGLSRVPGYPAINGLLRNR